MESEKETVIIVETPTVGCNGGTHGHPRVFLNLGAGGKAECPYCGQHFVLKAGTKVGSSH
ncbi:MAG: zinc-finger domain-containing protein [Rhodospirillales bacterium]|jgi:uncharacterized Zn-finger protein|nr:zinc-finger domain-containing protein [Rhodospirillales bacterium]MBT4005868.1 zinc-finger domain-containing protein [Rhodospirillales bacterium]MBT5076431.1 zinc-finger domain-containing protein [Rhodospirillales bacterium]MBT5114153.1 zinc-finger domain-containing protein [Rhodospirillales bacterium]MBT5672681.1 zinc-finger domain-containing protein [Rhodospirillales bacterium]